MFATCGSARIASRGTSNSRAVAVCNPVKLSRRIVTYCKAPQGSTSGATGNAQFLLKLVGSSFAGAYAVKYGSLLIDEPFQPSPLTALSLIALPCIFCAAYLFNLGNKSASNK